MCSRTCKSRSTARIRPLYSWLISLFTFVNFAPVFPVQLLPDVKEVLVGVEVVGGTVCPHFLSLFDAPQFGAKSIADSILVEKVLRGDLAFSVWRHELFELWYRWWPRAKSHFCASQIHCVTWIPDNEKNKGGHSISVAHFHVQLQLLGLFGHLKVQNFRATEFR